MNNQMLFIDGSVSTGSKIGYGAYLYLYKDEEHKLNAIETRVKLKRFENTSSTKLELQTLLWALDDIKVLEGKVTIFTDSQNILSLLKRRNRLEQNDFYSKNKNKLKNYELYIEFYRKTEKLNCEFIKVQGHKPSAQKNDIERFFTIVDRASRNALRNDISNI